MEAFDVKRTDAAGRITLGKESREKLFAIRVQPNGDILLSPVVVRHEREAWLFDNKSALDSVRSGLAQVGRGETVSRGSFAPYADDEVD